MKQDQPTPFLLHQGGDPSLTSVSASISLPMRTVAQQAWERFEHSGAITDYLRYKEALAVTSSLTEAERPPC